VQNKSHTLLDRIGESKNGREEKGYLQNVILWRWIDGTLALWKRRSLWRERERDCEQLEFCRQAYAMNVDEVFFLSKQSEHREQWKLIKEREIMLKRGNWESNVEIFRLCLFYLKTMLGIWIIPLVLLWKRREYHVVLADKNDVNYSHPFLIIHAFLRKNVNNLRRLL